MKEKQKYLFYVLLILSVGNMRSQVLSTAYSFIDCSSTSTTITLYNSDAPAAYNYTAECLSCSYTYTNWFNSSFEYIPVTCQGVYSFTFADSFNFQTYLTHTVYLSTQYTASILSVKDTICKDQNIVLSFSDITGTYTINPFSWSSSATVTPLTVSPTVTTTYFLSGLFTTASSRTCDVVGSKTVVVNDCTELEELKNATPVKIYPNPVKGILHIDIEPNNIQLICITDILGQIIFKPSSFSNEIDTSDFPNGIYFLNIQISGQKRNYKIIKE